MTETLCAVVFMQNLAFIDMDVSVATIECYNRSQLVYASLEIG